MIITVFLKWNINSFVSSFPVLSFSFREQWYCLIKGILKEEKLLLTVFCKTNEITLHYFASLKIEKMSSIKNYGLLTL